MVTGCGSNGQLGTGYTMAKELIPQRIEGLCGLGVVKLVCGRYHTLAMDKQGCVWTFGENSRGQCGLETALVVAAPERIGKYGEC